tara:strand:- start:395 stop:712 length:318 start_codon:yes stop_codon:yes gene_type:complete
LLTKKPPAFDVLRFGLDAPTTAAPQLAGWLLGSLAFFGLSFHQLGLVGIVMSSTPVVANLRRQALINSLRERYRLANERADALGKQALFREAIYLGIQPELFTVV